MRKGIVVNNTLNYKKGDIIEIYTAQEASEIEPNFKSYFDSALKKGCVIGFASYKGESSFYEIYDFEVDFETYKSTVKEIRSVEEIEREIKRLEGIVKRLDENRYYIPDFIKTKLETLKWVLKKEK